jgi:hypothetical protein
MIYLFSYETGVWTQGFMLVLYYLNHVFHPFCSPAVCLGWSHTMILLISASQVSRIACVNPWCLAPFVHLKINTTINYSSNIMVRYHTTVYCYLTVFLQFVLFVSLWSFLATERSGKIMVSTLCIVSTWPGILCLTDTMWHELLLAICSFYPPVGTANRMHSN